MTVEKYIQLFSEIELVLKNNPYVLSTGPKQHHWWLLVFHRWSLGFCQGVQAPEEPYQILPWMILTYVRVFFEHNACFDIRD